MLGLALGLGPAAAGAQGTAPAAESPLTGSLEAGLVRERSRFNVIRIDDAALLLSAGRARSLDSFRHGAATASLATPCGNGVVYCTANASWDTRTGQHSAETDTATRQADAGLQWRLGTVTVGTRYQREQWRVAGKVFRRVQGLAADAAAALDDSLSAYALATLARYRHPGDGAALDARYQSLTGNLRLATSGGWASAWTVQATLSRERNEQHDPALDNRGLMLRLAWEATPAPAWELRTSVIAQGLRFAQVDPLLGVRRSDRYVGVDLSLARRLSPELLARLELSHSLFRSSASAFDNDADSLGMTLAWSF